MTRIVLLLVLSLFGLGLQAQPKGDQAAAIDCRKTCGTKTCCIARSVSIPVCQIQEEGPHKLFLQAMSAENAKNFVRQCADPAGKAKGFVGLLGEPENYSKVEAMSCNWGCCGANRIAASIIAEPAIVSHYFPNLSKSAQGDLVKLAKLASKSTDYDTLTRRIAEASQGICIFCCTF